MSDTRDSLRDVLGAHLDRAQADAEAERKAAAMMERPALQARLEGVAALGSGPAGGGERAETVASERSEHGVVIPQAGAVPDRSTQRKVAIDPRFDPRLLVTQVKAAGPSRAGPQLAVAGLLIALAVGAWWLLRESTPSPVAPPISATAPVPSPPPATASTGEPAGPATAAPTGPTPTGEPAGSPSADPSVGATAAPFAAPTTDPAATPAAPTGARPAGPSSAAASPPGSAKSPPPASSGYKPLGGNGPVF